MKKKRFYGITVLLFSAVIIMGLIIIVFIEFQSNLERKLKDWNELYVKEIVGQETREIDFWLNHSVDNVKSIAYMFDLNSFENEESILQSLQEVEEISDFDRVRYVYESGKSISTDGSIIDISDRDYFKNMMQGEAGVSQIVFSKFQNEHVLVIYAPIFNEQGVVTSGIAGVYFEKSLKDKLAFTLFGVEQDSFLLRENGEIDLSTSEVYEDSIWGYFDTHKRALDNEKINLKEVLLNDSKTKNLNEVRLFETTDDKAGGYFLKLNAVDYFYYVDVKNNMLDKNDLVVKNVGTRPIGKIVLIILLAVCFTTFIRIWMKQEDNIIVKDQNDNP